MSGGWYGVDLDGTLAYYDEWRGIDHIGAPIWPMVTLVAQLIAEGKTVKIFTARISLADDIEHCITVIQNWLESIGLPRLEVTNIKDHNLIRYYDDRAVQVIENTGQIVGDIEVSPWVANSK